MKAKFLLGGFFLICVWAALSWADTKERPHFEPMDVFGLEFASDPQISPDGTQIVYERRSMDVIKDRGRSAIWILQTDGSNHRPISGTATQYDGSPRWSPDGKRLAFVSSQEGSAQIYVRWMDSGQTARLAQLLQSPGNLTWSPDGKWLAFTMMVPQKDTPPAKMPAAPEGAEWAEPVKWIERMVFRADGDGYLKEGFSHIFLLSADGGTPRQLSRGEFDHSGSLSWSPDGKSIFFSGNLNEDWEFEPVESEVYEVSVSDGNIRPLTKRKGPDLSPAISPDGKLIAYAGFDDRYQFYQVRRLYIMNRDGSGVRVLSTSLDRDVDEHQWAADGRGLFIQYDDQGDTKVAHISLDGTIKELAKGLGGTVMDRPYGGASFSLARNNNFACVVTRSDRPADVAVGGLTMPLKKLTALNEDVLGYKDVRVAEEIWFESTYDKRKVHGWIVKPPGFDASRKYPLILEIHGGPVANYGDRFAADIQLYAAAGYVAFYINPRGSDSYGEEFGNLIHHNYPGQDYDDLISGIDAVIARGYVDPAKLYVTGGSGGGVLSAWIVGHTDRFRAAVVAKPVINWTSFVLTADMNVFFVRYWFPGFPWEQPENYAKRSPLTYVGNIKTPTMVISGEEDYRTPISEAEQLYQALKMRKVPTALARVPGAPHDIARRPSQLIAKALYILAWFDKYK